MRMKGSSRSGAGRSAISAATRLKPIVAASFAALLAALVVAVSVASAAAAPEFLIQFGNGGVKVTGESSTSKAGQTQIPRGVAIDATSGHVLVADQTNARVDEFTAWGEFVRAFGWDVAPGAVNEQQEVRFRAKSGQFRLTFGVGGPGVSETGDLGFNATAAEVQVALNALTNISAGGGSVTVSEVPGNVAGTTPYIYVVTFKGTLAGTNVAQMTAANGTVPLSGGNPSTGLEATTRANGGPASTGPETCTAESGCQAGSSLGGRGQLKTPQGIAVDSSRNIYVVDKENHRVQKFNSAGEFVYMLGGGVNETEPLATICPRPGNPADVCKAGVSGAGNGEFASWGVNANLVAIGPGGAVYVADKERIQKFNGSTGAFESKITLSGAGETQALAVDPTGNLYVASASPANTVRKLDPTGTTVLSTIGVSEPVALALDPSGNLYVVSGNSKSVVVEFNSSGTEVTKFGSGEFPDGSTGIGVNAQGDIYVPNFAFERSYIRAFGPEPTGIEPAPKVGPTIGASYPASVAATTASVAAELTPHFWTTSYYVQYGPENCATAVEPCAERPLLPGTALGPKRGTSTVTVALSNLAPDSIYHFRFVASSHCNPAEPAEACTAIGPDRTFATRRAGVGALADNRAYEQVSPAQKNSAEIGVPGVAGPGSVEAPFSVMPQQSSTTGAEITYHSVTSFGNPQGAPFVSQYLSRRGDGGWPTENASPRFEEGYLRDSEVGFSPDLSHAAVVALQSIGEPPLGEPAPPGSFFNLFVRDNSTGVLTTVTETEPKVTAGQKFCIGYEGASANFDRVVFAAKNAFYLKGNPEPPSEKSNLYEWQKPLFNSQQVLTVKATGGKYKLIFGSGGVGVSETGEIEATATRGEVEAALNAITNISAGGGSVAVSGGPGNATGTTPYIITFNGGPLAGTPLPSLTAVNVSLAGGSSSATLATLANGHLALASTLPEGTPAAAQLNNSFGLGATLGLGQCEMKTKLLRHAISADGRRLFWTYGSPGIFNGASAPLFARVFSGNGQVETIQLDAPNTGVTGAGKGQGVYRDASVDGSKVFFTDGQKLTSDFTGSGSKPDLYRYDFNAAAGARLTDLTAHVGESANVQGVIAASEKGDYVYFVAKGVLTGSEENVNHEKAVANEENLYAWHEGETRFVAILSSAEPDSNDWTTNPSRMTARVSPNGRHLAFVSTRNLIGYDNTVGGAPGCSVSALTQKLEGSTQCAEVYLYDFGDVGPTCASCNPSGARPVGPSSVPVWNTPYEQPRYLSDEGRLFFDSYDALDVHDTNGRRDVYEFERPGVGSCTATSQTYSSRSGGCLNLISRGDSTDNSYFLDASTSGNDVFFSTRQTLVSGDEDERYDVYDARVGGGFTSTTSIECEGESCRGPGTIAPGASTPGTSVRGLGNPAHHLPRCPKGKVKRKGHCMGGHAKHHKKKHRRSRHSNGRAGK